MTQVLTARPLLGCRILVVEDNALIADMIVAVIEDAGAQVVGPFAAMVDALERLDDLNGVEGAILDIGLGAEESYPLATALQTTGIPFLFLTGLDRAHLPAGLSRAPHMLKPFSGEKLVARLVDIGVTRN